MTRWLKRLAWWVRRVGTDGCTGAPDLTLGLCCEEHDVYYRTGRDIRRMSVHTQQTVRRRLSAGEDLGELLALIPPISRWRADWRLLRCTRRQCPALAPVYWLVARLVGWWAWMRARK